MSSKKHSRSSHIAIASAIVFVVSLVPYVLTMCRTFSFFDKGELAASAVTLGIPHPTGYPTFMMIGWVFAKALSIVHVREIVALNLLAALLVSCSAAVMCVLFYDLLTRMYAPVSNERNAKNAKNETVDRVDAKVGARNDLARICLAGLAALVVAFSQTWWGAANGFEVYSLHALMIVLLTHLFLKYVDADAAVRAKGSSASTCEGVAFAVLLGLSFTNHLTTILLAPGFLFYYFRKVGIRKATWIGLLRLTPWFVLGLLPYVYLPIRSLMNAPINHTRPDTPARFMYHVLGIGFGDRMFSSFSVFRQQIQYFTNTLPYEAGFVGLIVAAVGIFYLFRKNLNLALMFALIVVFTVLFACNYAIADIDSYFLAAVFAIGVFVLVGVEAIRKRFGTWAAGGVALAIVTCAIAVNYAPNDEHDNYLVEDLAYNMLSTLPDSTLLFTGGWAHWHAGSYYLQYVEHFRPDVVVVDPTFMTLTWYLQMLRENHPDVANVIGPEIDRYIQLTIENNSDRPGDTLSAAEAGAYDHMVKALVARSIERRPVYATHDIVKDVANGYVRVPQVLAYKLTTDTSYVPQALPQLRFRMWKRRIDPFAVGICETYARMMIERAGYEQQHGHGDVAEAYAQYSLQFDPMIDTRDVPDMPLADESKVIRSLKDFRANRDRVNQR